MSEIEKHSERVERVRVTFGQTENSNRRLGEANLSETYVSFLAVAMVVVDANNNNNNNIALH